MSAKTLDEGGDVPTATEEARRRRIEEALAARSDDEERIREQWRGEDRIFDVITVPLDVILLNPRSHRIRAQLESHPSADTVRDDPYCDEAQEIIEELLRQTARFEELKRDLENVGQRDPGFISVTGLLVNANRRAVALKESQRQYLRVAVLPSDATQQEIDELELLLQMKKDLKEDYSFTNELLFVDDLINSYSHTPEQVAEILATSPEDVQQNIRLLALVREVQRLSNRRIKTIFFDDKQQALAEIDRKYEEVRQSDPQEALRVRNSRLVGLLLEMGYRELREINEDFLEEYFFPMLQERDEVLAGHIRRVTAPAPAPPSSEAIPGVEVLGEEDTDQTDPAQLLDLLANSVDEPAIELPADGGMRVTKRRGELLEELRESMERAAQDSREDRLQIDRLKAPIDALQQALRSMKRATEKYQRVANDSGFNLGKFQYALRKTESQLEDLKDKVERRSR